MLGEQTALALVRIRIYSLKQCNNHHKANRIVSYYPSYELILLLLHISSSCYKTIHRHSHLPLLTLLTLLTQGVLVAADVLDTVMKPAHAYDINDVVKVSYLFTA